MKQLSNFDPEFTILMPCLNERRTLPLCIREIQKFLSDADVSAEILVADNGSTDGSPAIARKWEPVLFLLPDEAMGTPCQAESTLREADTLLWAIVITAMIFLVCSRLSMPSGKDMISSSAIVFRNNGEACHAFFASISGDSCALLSGQETISYIYLRFSLWPPRFFHKCYS